MSTTRKLLWLRHASADQARQLQAAVPSMDLEKASKSWLPRPSPGRTAATVITFDGLSRRNGIAQFADTYTWHDNVEMGVRSSGTRGSARDCQVAWRALGLE